jgi:hypothetical protein
MKWHTMIKATDGTANFFLVTILEIPKHYLEHLEYEKRELSDLIDKYSEEITEDVFDKVMDKINSGNSVYERMQANTDYEQQNIGFDRTTQMYEAQKRLYEEGISILMDDLYKKYEADNPEPEPEPEPEPKPHKSKKYPNTGDWQKNLRIIQRNRSKGKARPKRNWRTSQRGGKSGYGGALLGGRSPKEGTTSKSFQCEQCHHARALRNRHVTESGQSICDYCMNSNKRTKDSGRPKEASGGKGGYSRRKYT